MINRLVRAIVPTAGKFSSRSGFVRKGDFARRLPVSLRRGGRKRTRSEKRGSKESGGFIAGQRAIDVEGRGNSHLFIATQTGCALIVTNEWRFWINLVKSL